MPINLVAFYGETGDPKKGQKTGFRRHKTGNYINITQVLYAEEVGGGGKGGYRVSQTRDVRFFMIETISFFASI